MELRALEKEVNEMASLYEALRRSTQLRAGAQQLPPIAVGSVSSEQEEKEGEEHSLADVLSTLESMREHIAGLDSKMERFRKRLSEKDPITDAPRYGKSTMARVTDMLATFDALASAIRIAFGEENESGDSSAQEPVVFVHEMRHVVQKQEEIVRQEELELAQNSAAEEAKRRAQQEQLLEQERKAEEAARLAEKQEQEEIARLAQETRQARQEAEQARLEQERLAREEAERVDREWVASIVKGPDGIRQQLATLRESTSTEEHAIALNALHTLFSQIVSHPEEVKFRRIRRDHQIFHQDIGRHTGGRELLVAAGFRLGAIDDVPCFISTEPDIEKDMDGWSEWFNLLKATLEILEEELIKS